MMKHLTWSLLGIVELDPLDSVDIASVTLVHFLFGVFLIVGVIVLVNMMIALLSNTYQRVEDNSLKEWSFKKAITIQTYSTYHPIPVPLNLLSHFYLWIKWLCHKCGCRKRNPGNNTRDDNNRDMYHKKMLLDDVVETLIAAYFSSYGYSFPLTDERKMDHVFHETVRNRQMANQIAYRTFAAKGVDDGAFPAGPKAWKSRGIRIQGCLLTYEGSQFCSTCRDNFSAPIHGARYMFPFSPDSPHFEVLVQETGGRRLLGIGVVGNDYGYHAMPGWLKGTVGYHIDEGKIFDAENSTRGKEYEDAMADRGDLIGCTVRFDLAKDGKVPVVFSLNGRQITWNEISMDYTHNEKFLYPYIGMGNQGLRVLAKMTSYQDADENHDVKITELNKLEGKLQREEVDSIMETLEEIGNKFQSSFQKIDDAFRHLHIEIDEGNSRFNGLVNEILTNFDDFERRRKSPTLMRRRRRPSIDLVFESSAAGVQDIQEVTDVEIQSEKQRETMEKDCVDTPDNNEYLWRRDSPKLRLVERLIDKIDQMERMTDEKFKAVFDAFRQITGKSQRHSDEQDELRGEVQKRFKEHKDFIRTNLRI
ncbi:uncharacterized protein [Porites lutea]|uniref:uncharacterized protein n=1 Tax=Porites lutea TaxID=51062 RepID=UPI003CC5D115